MWATNRHRSSWMGCFLPRYRTPPLHSIPQRARELWSFDRLGPGAPTFCPGPPEQFWGMSRGLAYWHPQSGGLAESSTGRPTGACSYSTPRLASLCQVSATKALDLRIGIDEKCQFVYGLTSPPSIYGDLVVIGVMTGEWPNPHRRPPATSARSISTPARKCGVFIRSRSPARGGTRRGSGARGSARRRQCLGWVTIDQKRGMVFAGLGAPVVDWYGGERLGDNLFSNSLIALDATTGKLRWYRQLVHHDLWDYDLAAPRRSSRSSETANRSTRSSRPRKWE